MFIFAFKNETNRTNFASRRTSLVWLLTTLRKKEATGSNYNIFVMLNRPIVGEHIRSRYFRTELENIKMKPINYACSHCYWLKSLDGQPTISLNQKAIQRVSATLRFTASQRLQEIYYTRLERFSCEDQHE